MARRSSSTRPTSDSCADERLMRTVRGDAGSSGRPPGGLGAGPVDDPVADVDDEAGVLGDLDEALGGEHLPGRLTPPQEGLDRHDRAALEVDLGLVPELQLLAFERTAEGLLDPQPIGDLGPEVVVEEREGVTATALGPVEGGVGLPQQGGRSRDGTIGGRRHREAHAGGGDQGQLTHGQRLAEAGHDPLADPGGLGGVVEVAHHDHELVTAEAPGHVAGAHERRQALRRHHQQAIADGVAEGVVHVLEVVEVEHEHRGGPLRPVRGRQRPLDLAEHLGPVGQARERVVGGRDEQLALGPLAGRDVAQRHGQVGDLTVRARTTA